MNDLFIIEPRFEISNFMSNETSRKKVHIDFTQVLVLFCPGRHVNGYMRKVYGTPNQHSHVVIIISRNKKILE